MSGHPSRRGVSAVRERCPGSVPCARGIEGGQRRNRGGLRVLGQHPGDPRVGQARRRVAPRPMTRVCPSARSTSDPRPGPSSPSIDRPCETLRHASTARGRQRSQGDLTKPHRAGRGEEEQLGIGNFPPKQGDEPVRVARPIQDAGAVAGQVDRIAPDGQREPRRSGGDQQRAAMHFEGELDGNAVKAIEAGQFFGLVVLLVDGEFGLPAVDEETEGEAIAGVWADCARPPDRSDIPAAGPWETADAPRRSSG